MKIKTKSGYVLDLSEMRKRIEDSVKKFEDRFGGSIPSNTLAILDALESALSIPHEVENMNEGVFGYNLALDRVREVAGVIEEPSVA